MDPRDARGSSEGHGIITLTRGGQTSQSVAMCPPLIDAKNCINSKNAHKNICTYALFYPIRKTVHKLRWKYIFRIKCISKSLISLHSILLNS